MKRPVVRSPAASSDVLDHVSYLAESSPQVADRFLDSVEATFELLAVTPELGATYVSTNPRLDDVRVWSVKGFAYYLIFYRASGQAVEILRILHGARDLELILGAS